MQFYEINREERHFGFLFINLLLSNDEFRGKIFSIINSAANINLSHINFDIYAEVAIFRDFWNSLGDWSKYDEELNHKRRTLLEGILESFEIKSGLIDEMPMFWTGHVGKSKLWFPGKWAISKINSLESEQNYTNKRLWRCRWLCNAKPDIMIQSGDNIIFIEIKVESGIGGNEFGYNQAQTQDDIMTVGSKIIPWMQNSNIKRINLWHEEAKNNISWNEVIQVFRESVTTGKIGEEMALRHLLNMPKAK